jgi:predicted MarR family transcription regulator
MVAVSWATIYHKEASPMAQKISILDIDIAKLVFHIVRMNDEGKEVHDLAAFIHRAVERVSLAFDIGLAAAAVRKPTVSWVASP